MSGEVTYDKAHEAEVLTGPEREEAPALQGASPNGGDGMGCHAGAAEMKKAAQMAGKS